MGKVYDTETWVAARLAYISSEYSLLRISHMYGIPKSTIFRRSKAEGWDQQRAEHRAAISKSAEEKLKTEGIKRIEAIAAAAIKVEDIAIGALEDEDQFYRYVMQEKHADGSTSTEEYVLKKLDIAALKGYIKVLMDLITVLRNVYELPDADKRATEEIARARLEIDRAKATASGAKTDNNEDELTGIIEIPAVKFEEQQDEERQDEE